MNTLLNTVLEKLKSYGFQCEAGPLINCIEWKILISRCAELETEVERLNKMIAWLDPPESSTPSGEVK